MTFGFENRSGQYAREERRVLLVCAALIAACYAVDLLSAVRAHALLLAMRVSWAGLIALLGLVHPRLSLSGRRINLLFAAATAPFFLTAIAAVGAPLPNPLFYWSVAFPLIIAVVVRGDVGLVVVNTAATIAASATGYLLIGEPLAEAGVFALLCLASGVLAIFGSLHIARVERAQEEAHAERVAALERLAHSERRRANVERMALLGQLSAGVAHEINNPLAFSLASVCFAQSPGVDDADRAEALADAVMGLERIGGIVQDLRLFSRGEGVAASIDAQDVRQIIHDAARLASFRLKDIAQVRMDLPEVPLLVLTDGRRLCQVLVNLLVNAADALEEAGRRNAEVRVRAFAADRQVVISVEDDGPGIPPEVLPRLFEPFFTSKAPGKGTGLGLALSREYLSQLGGTIAASNGPGGGARFEIGLPRELPARAGGDPLAA